MRKYFNYWKKVIDEKFRKLDAERMLKEKEKIDSLKNILTKYGKLIDVDKIKHYYFTKWMFINKRLTQEEYSNDIQNFCKIHLRNRLNILKWKKLKRLLNDKIRKRNQKDIIKLLKKYINVKKAIQKLQGKKNKNIFYNKFVKVFFDKLKNVKKIDTNILKKIIIRMNNKKKNILFKNALNKWRNNYY